MNLLAALILAHLLADFPLQTNAIFKLKKKGFIGILPHVLIHICVTAFLVKNPLQQLPLLLSLGVIHYAIDWYKVSHENQNNYCCSVISFLTDQAAHLASLICLAIIFSQTSISISPAFLYPCVIYAFVPAFLTLGWVFADNQQHHNSKVLAWVHSEVLVISQGAGLVLALLIAIINLFNFPM